MYPALVDGYFVMLKFTEPGSYMIHSWASAGREEKGPYFSELLYQIQVMKRSKPHGMITTMFPSRNEGLLNKTLKKKTEHGEMTDEQIKLPKSIHQNIIKYLKDKNSKI
jgi:hypothetical protein